MGGVQMNGVTRAAIRADSSIPSDRKPGALKFLAGEASDLARPLLVTQSEAARLLSMSRVTVYRLVRDGALHPVEVRGAKRYRVEDLERIARGG